MRIYTAENIDLYVFAYVLYDLFAFLVMIWLLFSFMPWITLDHVSVQSFPEITAGVQESWGKNFWLAENVH